MWLTCAFHFSVVQFSTENRMQTQNVAIVFGPTLMWSGEADFTNMAIFTVYQSKVVEFLLLEYTNLFWWKQIQLKSAHTIRSLCWDVFQAGWSMQVTGHDVAKTCCWSGSQPSCTPQLIVQLHTCQPIQFTNIKYIFFINLGGYGHIGKWIQENIIFVRFCCCFKLSKKTEKLLNEQRTRAIAKCTLTGPVQ